ncbi:dual specificity protein phosphatase [Synechococcus sp. CCY9202]|nr:dual specificity protein phosphatase [Synechococcus sp. CCY9202]
MPVADPPSRRRFRIDWVLRQELALGPALLRRHHLDQLEQAGLCGVLSLSGVEEAPPPLGIEQRFRCRRLVLPDHRSGRLIEPAELEAALELLAELSAEGPVFVHCVAAMERSPLVCLAWLMRRRGLSQQQALDYLMQVHPGTSPLPGQLRVLEGLNGPTGASPNGEKVNT